MSEDERLTRIKDLLDSTVAEFESIFESAGGFDQSRVGNGWTPSSIPVKTYVINPMPFSEAKRIAESRKSRLFGPLGFVRLRSRKVETLGEPLLVYLPYWRASAYHECFYFRARSYRATVPEDVVAVQVGGQIRALRSEIRPKRSALSKLFGVLKRVVLARPEPRYFEVDGATELAYQLAETSVLVDGDGKRDLSMEYLLEKRPQMRLIEKGESLVTEALSAKFAPLSFTVEDVVRLLHGRVVRPPVVFSKIVTNRFEVTELTLLELPIYLFRYRNLAREKELRIHGVTGDIMK